MLVKVCGMRNNDNILAVEKLGVDIIGFIFYPQSPRYFFGENRNKSVDFINNEKRINELNTYIAEGYSKKVHDKNDDNCFGIDIHNHNSLLHRYMPKWCKRAGVFVNMSVDDILNIAKALQLDYIQLHGDESTSVCKEIKESGFNVIKTFHIEKEDDITNIDKEYHRFCDIFLFDTKCSVYGGSGREFDWNLLNKYKGPTPFIISGGVGYDNINEIKKFHHPHLLGVDLNSKFESSPGVKNITLLKQYISELKN